MLAIISLGVLLEGINTSTLDVALPSVARHFHASATEASWVLLSYMLVNAILILAFGRLSDILGRRPVYIAGLAVFTVASLGCAFAPNVIALIALRSLQAAGGAAIITNVTAQITDAFPSRMLSLGLGLQVMISSIAQIIGPVLGGLLAVSFGWSSLFWFNVPIGVVGLIGAWFGLRRQRPPQRRERFDLSGAALSFFGLGGLILALSEAGAIGWSSTPTLVGIGLFVVAGPAFIFTQLRSDHPVLALSLFAERHLRMAYLSAFLLALAQFGVVLLIALYLQAADGIDAFRAGLAITPVAAGMMVASPIVGALAHLYSPRRLSTTGLAMTAAGLLTLTVTLSPHLPYGVLAAALFVMGAGGGTFLTPNTSSIMHSVPKERRGQANGLRSTLQNAGYVVSVALSLGIVTHPLHPAEKRAAYAGTLSHLAGRSLSQFGDGYHYALFALFVATAGAGVASMLRSRDPASAAARPPLELPAGPKVRPSAQPVGALSPSRAG